MLSTDIMGPSASAFNNLKSIPDLSYFLRPRPNSHARLRSKALEFLAKSQTGRSTPSADVMISTS